MQQQALRIWVIAYVLHLFLVIVADGQGIDLPVSDPNELLTHMVVPVRATSISRVHSRTGPRFDSRAAHRVDFFCV